MESNTNRRPSFVPTARYILRIRKVSTGQSRIREIDLIESDLDELTKRLNKDINGYVLEALYRKYGDD